MTTRIEWRAWWWPVFMLCTFVGAGCDQKGAAVASAAASRELTQAADTGVAVHDLTLYGYNYTDTEIGSFEVNGHGGGNVQISDPDNGGGSAVCCIAVLTPMTEPKLLRIKWTRDSEMWCEQEVALKPPIPEDAKRLEVHFYRDGHIEVAVTGELQTRMSSPPRLRLEAPSRAGRNTDTALNVNNDSKFARCKLGYN
jgi:hypothetical protein